MGAQENSAGMDSAGAVCPVCGVCMVAGVVPLRVPLPPASASGRLPLVACCGWYPVALERRAAEEQRKAEQIRRGGRGSCTVGKGGLGD